MIFRNIFVGFALLVTLMFTGSDVLAGGLSPKDVDIPDGCKAKAFQLGESGSRTEPDLSRTEPVVYETDQYRVGSEEDQLLSSYLSLFNKNAYLLAAQLGESLTSSRELSAKKKEVWDFNWNFSGAGLMGRAVSVLIDQPVTQGKGLIGFGRKKINSNLRQISIVTGVVTRFSPKMGFAGLGLLKSPKEREHYIQMVVFSSGEEQLLVDFKLSEIRDIRIFPQQVEFSNEVQKTKLISYFNFRVGQMVVPYATFTPVNGIEKDLIFARLMVLLDERSKQAVADSQTYRTRDGQGVVRMTSTYEPESEILNLGSDWRIDISSGRDQELNGEPLLDTSGSQPKMILPRIKGAEVILIKNTRDEWGVITGMEVISGMIDRAFHAEITGQKEIGRFFVLDPFDLPQIEINMDDILNLRVVVPKTTVSESTTE